jgi:hypothetical protein
MPTANFEPRNDPPSGGYRPVTPAAVCPKAAGGSTSGQDQRTNQGYGHGRGPGDPAEPFAVTSISGSLGEKRTADWVGG